MHSKKQKQKNTVLGCPTYLSTDYEDKTGKERNLVIFLEYPCKRRYQLKALAKTSSLMQLLESSSLRMTKSRSTPTLSLKRKLRYETP